MSQSRKVLLEAGLLNVVNFSGDGVVSPVEALSAARTITDEDNNKVFEITAAAGVAVTLPAVSTLRPGWSCKFVQGVLDASVTGDSTITATAAIMSGGIVAADGGVGSSSETGTVITFDESAASDRGDEVTLTVNNDSTLIYVKGSCGVTVAITIA